MAGTQNIGQIRKNYGPDSAEAMLSLFNTKAIFRLPEPVSAEWASRYMGDLIWNQARESVRYGTSETMDGASIADGRVVERKVMPHEIIDLPDRTAFLSIAGDFPIAKATTQFDRKTDPARMKRPAFVPRAFADLAWGDADRIPQPKRSTDTQRPTKPERGEADSPKDQPGPEETPKRVSGAEIDWNHPYHPDNRTDGDPGPQMPKDQPPAVDPDIQSLQARGVAPPTNAEDQRDPNNAPDAAAEGADRDGPTAGGEDTDRNANHETPGEQFDPFDKRPVGEKIDELDAEGLSQREIASRLNITRYKVQQHQEAKKSGDA